MNSLTGCALLLLLQSVLSAPAGDLITNLPRFSGPLLSPQYSGYVPVGTSGKQLHYWFIESLNKPSTDPVVLWMNGGPGCSSMDGLFYEMGPIHFGPGSDDKPTIVWNPYSWVNLSNMLFLEAPAGVGFSYSTDQDDYNTNDTQTAADNYAFLVNWVKKFPEFAKNDFWISGESYAGVYVPTLANLVLNGIQKGEFTMNFKGVLVGNGVTPGAAQMDPVASFEFAYGHGMYSDADHQTLVTACADPNSDACQNIQNEIVSHFQGAPLNPYNIYDECTSQRPFSPLEFAHKNLGKAFASLLSNKRAVRVRDTPPCVDSYAGIKYLNLPEVQKAIHVQPTQWDICSDQINYNSDVSDVLSIYRRLVSAGKTVFIYSGDVDMVVDYTYSEAWTSNMGFTATRSWQPWTFNDNLGSQTGGWVTDYQGGFTFATVRGSGHMVPQYRPKAAFAMFQRVISGTPL